MEQINLGYFQLRNKSLTVSLASWLLEYFHETHWWETNTLNSFTSAIASACKQFKETLLAPKSIGLPKKDSNLQERIDYVSTLKSATLRVYSDYEVAKDILSHSKFVEFVNSLSDSEFALTLGHVKDFITMPINQRICQFPFEAGLIRKVF